MAVFAVSLVPITITGTTLDIHLMSNWFKMFRVHAARIAAEMIENQAFGDGPHPEFVGVTMRWDFQLPLATPHVKTPVPVGVPPSSPFPTSTAL